MLHDETETAMADALVDAGIADETPLQRVCKIAEDCWQESEYSVPGQEAKKGHDPVCMMRLFKERIRDDAALVLCVVGERYWHNLIRTFLSRDKRRKDSGWDRSNAFRRAMIRLENKEHAEEVGEYKKERTKISAKWGIMDRSRSAVTSRESRQRKQAGIKRVSADVSVVTGEVIQLIDKEFGPYSHIRINTLKLPEATTEQALTYCDTATTDVKFIRALCHLIPDPFKPIGEQWTAEMIREAKHAATRMAEVA